MNKVVEKARTKKRFRIGRIHHHQTLMPEILAYISRDDAMSVLFQASVTSRAYLFKNFNFLKRVF